MRNDCFKIFSVQRDPLGRKEIVITQLNYKLIVIFAELTLIYTQELGNRAWCVSFSDDKPLFACGTSAGDTRRSLGKSIWIYDTER